MSLGYSFNKYKNGLVLQAKTPEGLLRMIQEIKCHVEIIQVYFDGKMHVAFIVTNKKLIKKTKQE